MASETCKLEVVKELRKCNPHKFFELLKYTVHHIPSVFPECYKSAEVIEGDGKSVGSVRLWKYVLPGTTEVLEAKEKTEVIDDENMVMAFDVFEGDHKGHYRCFVLTAQVIPEGERASVKWTLEYQKHDEGKTDPHLYMDMFGLLSERLDDHLHQRPRGSCSRLWNLKLMGGFCALIV